MNKTVIMDIDEEEFCGSCGQFYLDDGTGCPLCGTMPEPLMEDDELEDLFTDMDWEEENKRNNFLL